jgi:hypothetical protein
MADKKNSWVYITLLLISVFGVFLLIFISYQDQVHLSLPVYFFLLILCDLAATAFLTGAMKSTAEWSGNVLKGNLKLTGPAVVFILILLIGYRYRPIPKDDPFDFTIILLDPSGSHMGFPGDSIQITLANDIRNAPVNNDGKAVFYNVDARYLGKPIPLSAKIEGFKISRLADTLITIPNSYLPVVRLTLTPTEDSSLFSGLLLRRNPDNRPIPIPLAILNFTEYSRTVISDSLGRFIIYLKAKNGEGADINVFKQQKLIFSGKIPLSKNMQILADE